MVSSKPFRESRQGDPRNLSLTTRIDVAEASGIPPEAGDQSHEPGDDRQDLRRTDGSTAREGPTVVGRRLDSAHMSWRAKADSRPRQEANDPHWSRRAASWKSISSPRSHMHSPGRPKASV